MDDAKCACSMTMEEIWMEHAKRLAGKRFVVLIPESVGFTVVAFAEDSGGLRESFITVQAALERVEEYAVRQRRDPIAPPYEPGEVLTGEAMVRALAGK